MLEKERPDIRSSLIHKYYPVVSYFIYYVEFSPIFLITFLILIFSTSYRKKMLKRKIYEKIVGKTKINT